MKRSVKFLSMLCSAINKINNERERSENVSFDLNRFIIHSIFVRTLALFSCFHIVIKNTFSLPLRKKVSRSKFAISLEKPFAFMDHLKL